MQVSALPPARLAGQLRESGLYFNIGPFTIHLQSGIPGIADGIALFYPENRIMEEQDFADFHVSLTRPKNLRRWFHPQVSFSIDNYVPFKPLPYDQAFPMFEWCLNWCVANHAHQYLIIHSAVVEKGGFAAIIPGPPGAGKSTLCAALVLSGWRLLSDELALISMDGCTITPLPRPVSLKNESIDVIRRFSPGVTIGRSSTDTVKGTVAHMRAPLESVQRCDELAQPAWIIVPEYRENAETSLMRITRASTFMHLAKHSFNYSLLGRKGFESLATVVDASDCFGLTYGDLDDAIRVFDGLDT